MITWVLNELMMLCCGWYTGTVVHITGFTFYPSFYITEGRDPVMPRPVKSLLVYYDKSEAAGPGPPDDWEL